MNIHYIKNRHEMIAIAAYYLAEQRNFALGGAEYDWLRAEHQIDQMLSVMDRYGHTDEDLKRIGLRNALLLWSDFHDDNIGQSFITD
jgi:hypothetical protein